MWFSKNSDFAHFYGFQGAFWGISSARGHLKSIYFTWNPNFCVKSRKKREIPILGKTTWEGLRSRLQPIVLHLIKSDAFVQSFVTCNQNVCCYLQSKRFWHVINCNSNYVPRHQRHKYDKDAATTTTVGIDEFRVRNFFWNTLRLRYLSPFKSISVWWWIWPSILHDYTKNDDKT